MIKIKKTIREIPAYCLRQRGLLLGTALLLTTAIMITRPRTAEAHPCAYATDCLITVVPYTGVEDGFHSQPVISGDGTRIAFWSTGNLDNAGNADNADGSIEIFIHYSSHIVQVTRSSGSILGGFNLAPSISFDGTRIAFFSDRDLVEGYNTDGNFEIFVASVGSNPFNPNIQIIQVTNTTKGVNISPSISGDGRHVVFTSDALDQNNGHGGNMEIFMTEIIDMQTLTTTRITDTDGSLNDQPVIDKTGSRIAFISDADLDENNSNNYPQVFVYNVGEGNFIQVTDIRSPTITNDQPAINDNGEYVAYVSNLDGNPEIFRARVGDINPTQVTSTTVEITNNHPDLNGDGSLIIFTSNGDLAPTTGPGNPDGNYEIFLGDIDAGPPVTIEFAQLSDTEGINSAYPSISADGDSMAFSADREIKKNTCVLADLSISKAVSSVESPPGDLIEVSAGDFLTYTLTITNGGPSTAIGVQLVDVLPMTVITPSLRFTSSQTATVDCATFPITTPHQAHNVACNLLDMTNDASAVVTISFQISPTYRGIITNTARVSSNVDDSDIDNNQSNVVIATLIEMSDLEIDATAAQEVVVAGTDASFAYTLTVTNNGPSDILTNTIYVTDTLPQELNLTFAQVDVTLSDNSCTWAWVGGSVVVTCGSEPVLNVGETITAVITVDSHDITRTMAIVNTAVVASVTDFVTGNNTDTDTTTLSVEADLGIAKSSSLMVPGDLLTYTIVVTNSGPSSVISATVSDTIPIEISNVSWSCTSSPDSVCTTIPSSGHVTDTVTIAQGGRLEYTVIGILNASVTTTVMNTAIVRAPTGTSETNTFNNTATDQNTVYAQADLQISKNDYPDPVMDSDVLTFTLLINNNGPSDAWAITVNDTLLPNLTFDKVVGATAPFVFQGQSNQFLTWSAPMLSANGSASITFTVQVDPFATGVISNSAEITSSTPDPFLYNNNAIELTSVNPAVGFERSTYSVNEDAGEATITVTLNAAISETVTVQYATIDGTATSPDDYTIKTGNLTFEPGETTKTFDVPIIDEVPSLDEINETVVLSLTNASRAVIGPINPATLTILDNEPLPVINFTSAAYSESEGVSTATINVMLDALSSLTIMVNYATSDGTATTPNDYDATSGTLTFVPESTSGTFDIIIVDDELDEPDETIMLYFSAPVNANIGSTSTLTIDDNDALVVDFSNADYNVDEDVSEATIVATLNITSVWRTVTVDYTTAGGTATSPDDYSAANSTLTFVPGEISQTFAIPIVDDELDEPSETIILNLDNASNASTGPNDPATLTIHDNDCTPQVDLNGTDSGTGFDAAFTEDLGAVSIVDVDLSVADCDYTNLTSATVTITNLQDGAAEVLMVTTTGTSIVASYNGAGVLNLTGSDTIAHYQLVLRTVTYNNTSQNPGTMARSIEFVVSDGTNSSNVAVSTVTIISVNDPPNAVNDSATVDEGGTVIDTVLTNDSDPEGDDLTVDPALIPQPPPNHGLLTLNPNGTFSYIHDGSETTSDYFDYPVCDDGTPSECDTATVNITINPVNDPPNAVNDSATVDEGGTVTVLDLGSSTVLDNDSDSEGDNLTVNTTPVFSPSHGTLTLNANGTFGYTHDSSETTSDSFIYRVCDDGTPVECDTATVNITITPVNDPPNAVDDSFRVGIAGTLTDDNVLVNDSDPEGDNMTVTTTPVSSPTHGTLTLDTDGTFTYVHTDTNTVNDSFDYQVCDTAPACATATVNIIVGRTYYDDFRSGNYTGSWGTEDWIPDWVEYESGGNDIKIDDDPLSIFGKSLLFKDNAETNDYIRRRANIGGATSAVLSINYLRQNLESDDSVVLEISYNGGLFDLLRTYSGVNNDDSWQSDSIILTGDLSAQVVIRFRVASTVNDPDDEFYIDNVKVWYEPDPALFALPSASIPPPTPNRRQTRR